jgi:hypothetical protein
MSPQNEERFDKALTAVGWLIAVTVAAVAAWYFGHYVVLPFREWAGL